jgi:hypothetical protein
MQTRKYNNLDVLMMQDWLWNDIKETLV